MRKFLLLLAASSLLPLFAAGELSGRRAPGFALPDLNLNYHDLQDHRGKVVVLDVMMTSCPHCLAVSKNLERLKAKYGSRVIVMSIVSSSADNQQTVSRFLTANKITTPFLFDCGQVTASYLKVTLQKPTITLPHVFLIDAQGMIRNDFSYSDATKGLMEGDGLGAEIDKLLNPGAAPKKAAK
jgi:peroxiredoxin